MKKFLILLALFLTTLTTSLSLSTPTYAAGEDAPITGRTCQYFLGMVSWDCEVPKPTDSDGVINMVITIAANVFTDLTVIAAYLVVGYVIYGGYLYMFASGDAAKAASGKKTLTRAFIGLAIVLLTNVILNTIRIILLGSNGQFGEVCSSDNGLYACNPNENLGTELVLRTINWVTGIAGIVAAAFAVMGGINYVTSSGDAGKLAKAKQTIFYALIGLAIVGLSTVITAFVSNMINSAESSAPTAPAEAPESESTSYYSQTLISKESYEK